MDAGVSLSGLPPARSLSLSRLVAELGSGTAALLGTPTGTGWVLGSEFYEALDELPEGEGTLLLVSSGSRLAPGALETIAGEAAERHYAGIALKCDDEEARALAAIAAASGIPIVRVAERVGWRLFEALVSRLLGDQRRSEDAHLERGAEPLFALANELAGFFGGSVAIEDLGRRILAYSSVPGLTIDRVRTQGILDRRVPAAPFNDEQYRTLLRSEAPVKYPQLGDELPRVAVAIRAGALPLGSIWAIDASGDAPITDEQIARMRSGASVAAAHLLDDIRVREAGQVPRENHLRALLGGGDVTGAELVELGISEKRGAALLAFDPGADEHPAVVAQLRSTVHRHLTLHRPEAVIVARRGRVYALVANTGEPELLDLVSPLLPILDRLMPGRVTIALAGAAHRAAAVAALRERADALFGTTAHWPELAESRILTVERLRPQLIYERHAELLEHEPELAHPGVASLMAEHPALAVTLGAWCRNSGNIARTARDLGVHENTVRYRVRRASELAALDLEQPDALLTAWLQLRAGERVLSGF